jgi:zinc protease
MSVSSIRNRARLSAIVVSLIVVGTRDARGQTLDRSVRPVARTNKLPVFPTPTVRTLANGLRVVIVENHSLPLVAVRAVPSFDSTADIPGKEGLYAMTLGMLREGTTSRTADQIATTIGTFGADVAPTRFTTLTASADSSLALMADMLTHPAFPEAAVERRAAMLVSAAQRQAQSAAWAPRRLVYRIIFGSAHSFARSVSAGDASIKSITRDDITAFYGKYFRPENMTLVIVGDVRTSDVLESATKLFGAWPRRGAPYVLPSESVAPAAPTTVYLIDRPKAQQVYVFVGQLGPGHSAGDNASVEALAPILGLGSQSRLTRNLRDRHAYLYSGTPFAQTFVAGLQSSILYGSGAFAPVKTDSALTEWMSEFKAIRADRPPTPQEVASAETVIENNVAVSIETVDRLADRLVGLARLGAPLDYDNRLLKRIATLTPADIQAAAVARVDPEHLVIVVAGDRSNIEAALRALNLGPVIVVDENGQTLK